VLRPVLLLALPGVLVTTLVVGGLVALALGLPLSVALLFGSLVAASDPVAVIAVLKEIALPARLLAVPEAKSLVNDGMAITLYTGLGGVHAAGSLDLGGVDVLFLREVLVGLAVGAVVHLGGGSCWSGCDGKEGAGLREEGGGRTACVPQFAPIPGRQDHTVSGRRLASSPAWTASGAAAAKSLPWTTRNAGESSAGISDIVPSSAKKTPAPPPALAC
jgi:hypothetical protein